MRYVILVLMVFAGINLHSQDKKAQKLLDKLSDQYTKSASISVDFDLTVVYPEEKPVTYPSNVIQKGKKFLFRNSEQEYYGNGADVWIYIPSKNEVQINDFDEEDAEDYIITPLDLLKQYKSGKYEYQISEDQQDVIDIEFVPIDNFSDYSKYRISVIKKNEEISSIVAFGKDGSKITIDISKIIRDKKYPDSTFVFDKSKYPGVRVEDLRLD